MVKQKKPFRAPYVKAYSSFKIVVIASFSWLCPRLSKTLITRWRSLSDMTGAAVLSRSGSGVPTAEQADTKMHSRGLNIAVELFFISIFYKEFGASKTDSDTFH